jgi:hypothetical protein
MTVNEGKCSNLKAVQRASLHTASSELPMSVVKEGAITDMQKT